MKLVATTITDISVHLRYADHADPTKATEWMEFQVLLKDLLHPGAKQPAPLREPECQYLGEVEESALARAQTAIEQEIRRLKGLRTANPFR